MSPDSITSLVKVRDALNKVPCTHTQLFVSLIDNGNNHPYSYTPARRRAFGPDDSDFPGLGRKLSPFVSSKLPSLGDLQTLLVNDFEAAQQVRSINSGKMLHVAEDAQGGERDDSIKLLSTLNDSSKSIGSVLLAFHSPSLDDICGDSKIACDEVMRESMTMAAVLPSGKLLTLQHSNEGTTFTTLLRGSVAWIIWPPTIHNLGVLECSYEAFAEGSDDAQMDLCGQLQGGICLVQSVGEAIRIPPFCPIICLSLETSVLATYSVVTVSQLANMLGKLPLLLAWFKTEIDGERKKKDFTTALLAHLSSVLQGGSEAIEVKNSKYPYSGENSLRPLLHSWDEIKHVVARFLDPLEAEKVILMWDQFLRKVKGRQCLICGSHISNKQKGMRNHIESKHWPTEKIAEDSKQHVQSQHEAATTVARPKRSDTLSHDSFYDAMEVIEVQSETLLKRTASQSPEQTAGKSTYNQMDVDEPPEASVHI